MGSEGGGGTLDILKLANSNNVSASWLRFFKSVKCLTQALYDQFFCADNSLKAYEPHVKDSRNEVDIREGGKRITQG